ncbi:DUF535 family protein [Terriglobus roseus]|uniref:Uncharacterized protein n=1 Tax=Terriglobus roseus TaxID=392734 RepID=A0A1H4KF65_9BACT|nr:DUF535 family protein [Terriglobus roseus]SEB56582.1 hypothetical protein SAMN05443244_1145 [Terriglobus roseus]
MHRTMMQGERKDERPDPGSEKRHLPDNRSFFGVIASLIQRKGTFRRSSIVLVNAIANLRTFPEIFKLLRKEPFFEALRTNPRLVVRCLTPDYLVRGFTVGVGARCFLHHHRRLQGTLPTDLVRQLMLGQVTLFETTDENAHISITIGQTRPLHDKEGELDIKLCVEGKTVFLLSFTVVPGAVAGSEAGEIMLISRMQGVAGCYSEIKLARKVLADVAPNALLLAAMQGIAMSLGIEVLASVSSHQQNAYREEVADRLHRNYEEFLGELGIEKNAAGFLVSVIPIPEKPMTSIKTGHKLRTKEKRATKLAVRDACHDFFRARIVGEHTAKIRLIHDNPEVRQASATESPI